MTILATVTKGVRMSLHDTVQSVYCKFTMIRSKIHLSFRNELSDFEYM